MPRSCRGVVDEHGVADHVSEAGEERCTMQKDERCWPAFPTRCPARSRSCRSKPNLSLEPRKLLRPLDNASTADLMSNRRQEVAFADDRGGDILFSDHTIEIHISARLPQRQSIEHVLLDRSRVEESN